MENIFDQVIDSDLKCWSKQKIREKLLTDPRLADFVDCETDYSVTPSMVVMYNFAGDELAGSYKTVAFDRARGIIVSKKTTKRLINEYTSDKVVDFSYSRALHEQLKIKNFQVLACGAYSYFSLAGYSRNMVDWVALHQMTNLTVVHNQSSFCGEHGLIFHFDKDFTLLKKNLADSLAVNKMCILHLHQALADFGMQISPKGYLLHTLATDWERGRNSTELADTPSALTMMRAKDEERLAQVTEFLQKEYGIDCRCRDLEPIVQRVKARKYLWN